ncbi:MAG: RDD family protein [Candidatus Eremiobacterota bacterium]
MPYCPVCNQEQREEARCPMCRAFFVERRCPDCGAQVLPKEIYCGRCGQELASRARLLVGAELCPAPLLRRLVAGCVDLVVLALSTEMVAALLGLERPVELIIAVCGTVLLYYGLFQSRGRQTLGQHVLRITALREDRHPLGLGQSLLRTATALVGWLLIFPPLTILLDREKRGWLDRKLKIRIWSTP